MTSPSVEELRELLARATGARFHLSIPGDPSYMMFDQQNERDKVVDPQLASRLRAMVGMNGRSISCNGRTTAQMARDIETAAALLDNSANPDFTPCPTCHQYSHSIGNDALADAFLHFDAMIAHPVRGHPMGDAFDDKTRDAAQVLMAAARGMPGREEIARIIRQNVQYEPHPWDTAREGFLIGDGAAADAILDLSSPGEEMVAVPREDLARIRKSMAMLQQNSVGCAENHYGGDRELHGLPGWLSDTKRDLEVLTSLLSASPASNQGGDNG